MIDQRFIEDLAQDLVVPKEPTPEMQLASANTGVTTDGGAFVGYRMNMPKGLNTPENIGKQSVLIADTLAGGGKGMMQGFVGLPGDLESIGRMALNYLGYNVDENTALPTSEEIGKKLESVLGPVIPQGQTTSVPTAERVRAAEGGTTGGEIIAPGGQIKLGAKVAKPVIGATKKIIEAGKDLPVGMSIKGVDESLDPLGFYSAASKAVDNIAQEKGTGAQFLAQIEKTPGVKKEELLWTGLDDFLKNKKSVTKAEIKEYLSRNRVEIEENRLDVMGNQSVDDFGFNRRNAEVIDDYDYIDSRAEDIVFDLRDDTKYLDSIRNEVIDDLGFTDEVLDDVMVRQVGEEVDNRLIDLARKQASEEYYDNPYYRYREDNGYEIVGNDDVGYSITSPNGRAIGRGDVFDLDEAEDLARQDALEQGYLRYEDEGAKFADYTLPGGENYRELLIRMPNKTGRSYYSGHFEEENILAHLRVNDRVVDGKKTLFVEEVQSDWHQEGRKKGYADEVLKDKLSKLTDEREDIYKAFKSSTTISETNVLKSKLAEIDAEYDSLQKIYKEGVPDAPFKTTWHELAMKRAIQLASEGGYDRIAFTTGAQQADRYNLAKQVNSIDWTPYESRGANKLVTIVPKNGNRIELPLDKDGKVIESIGGQFAGKSIDDIVGKDIAKKIMDTQSDELSGAGLSIGGEGMKGFYDNILPKFLDKYGKKWDAKVGMTELPTRNKNIENKITYEDGKYLVDMGDGINYNSYNTKADAIRALGGDDPTVHYMDITPKMKESVLTKGQPLFQMAPAIPAGVAAGQQEDNK